MTNDKDSQKRVTLKDISLKTGYTITTISHALHDKPDISAATKKQIREIADDMGYVVDNAASSLRLGKTNTIAIIIPDLLNPHIAYQVYKIEIEAKQRGYSAIILNTNENEQLEHDAIVTCYQKRVDGILICPTQVNTNNIKYIQKLKIPFVLIGRYFDNFDTDYVCCDDVKSGYLACDYLIGLGCKQILYLGAYDYVVGSNKRFEGIKKRIGSDKEINVIRHNINPQSKHHERIVEFMQNNFGAYDSIIVFSDMLAFEIIYDIQCKNLSEFKNIPFVSFDTIQTHFPFPFHHTSVGMVKDGWATDALNVLCERMNGNTDFNGKIDIDVALKTF